MVAFSAEMLHVNGVSAAITLNDDVNANKSAMSLFMVSAVGLILGRTLFGHTNFQFNQKGEKKVDN